MRNDFEDRIKNISSTRVKAIDRENEREEKGGERKKERVCVREKERQTDK